MTDTEIAEHVTGVVLAGGRSARMGRAKSALPYGGVTFLDHAIGMLAGVVAKVLVISGDASATHMRGVNVHADVFPGCGPLGGIHSALLHAETEVIIVCPTDMPLITATDVYALLAAASRDTISIACTEERWHPLLGIYPVLLAEEFEAAILCGMLRMRDVLQRASCGFTCVPMDEAGERLVNINTPEEYQRLLRDS